MLAEITRSMRAVALAAALAITPAVVIGQAMTDTTAGVVNTDDNDGFDWGWLGLLGLLGLLPRKRKDEVVETRTTGTAGTTGRGY
jgi:hypothetical protein